MTSRRRTPTLNTSWMTRAACGGIIEAWWHSSDPADIARAVQVCDSCPVADACRAYAETNREPAGIWGGIDMSTGTRPEPVLPEPQPDRTRTCGRPGCETTYEIPYRRGMPRRYCSPGCKLAAERGRDQARRQQRRRAAEIDRLLATGARHG